MQQIVYLIFNEGYYSTSTSQVIREDLCGEAVRLASLLAHDERTNTPTTNALCSLVLLHAARINQRCNSDGIPVLLADQDRNLWDSELIDLGAHHLNLALTNNTRSTYHFEAMVAWQHCSAICFEETDWKTICSLYEKLIAMKPSPGAKMARAIAVGYRDGPGFGLDELYSLSGDESIKLVIEYDPNYHASIADFAVKVDDKELAMKSFDIAIGLACNSWQIEWLTSQRARLI